MDKKGIQIPLSIIIFIIIILILVVILYVWNMSSVEVFESSVSTYTSNLTQDISGGAF